MDFVDEGEDSINFFSKIEQKGPQKGTDQIQPIKQEDSLIIGEPESEIKEENESSNSKQPQDPG